MARKLLSSTSRKLIAEIRRKLREAADPARAGAMQAYMKSEMPYLGVQTPARRVLSREVFRAHPLGTGDEWRATILALWREARFREERYVAIHLSGHSDYARFQTMGTLPMYEEMITTGAWWDYVDAIAVNQLGDLLRACPRGMKVRMRSWSRSRDIWKRRSAILCQIKHKKGTDLELLYSCIERSMGEEAFFLRKAIGWALREYAKTDGREVLRYVRRHRKELSPLSKREALKGLIREGKVEVVP